MKKLYTLVLISTLSFYFTSAQNAASNNCITIAAAGPDTTICSNNCVQLYASGGTKYSWSPGKLLNDSTISDPFTCLYTTTTFTVTVTDSNCTAATATVTINVLPSPPIPNITESNDTLHCSTDSSYATYQWYDTNALISGATDTFLVILPHFCDNYNIKVCSVNGCCVADGIEIFCEGINALIDEKVISLYPNPATNQLTIHASSLHSDKPATVFITNVLGQETSPPTPLSRKIGTGAGEGGSATIDVSALPAGLYFVRVIDEKQSWTGRFVKE